jgi:tRNA(Ile)-lysidine synthase
MKVIDRILKLENSEVGAICEISQTIIAVRDRQVITIARKLVPNKVDEKIEKTGKYTIGNLTFVLKEVALSDVEHSPNSKIEFLDYNLIPQVLTIRNWEHGDEFNPLGMTGSMKVSDFLSNEKIPILEKPNVLVLTTPKNEIMWICKHRINDKFKITPTTTKVLKIEIKEKMK